MIWGQQSENAKWLQRFYSICLFPFCKANAIVNPNILCEPVNNVQGWTPSGLDFFGVCVAGFFKNTRVFSTFNIQAGRTQTQLPSFSIRECESAPETVPSSSHRDTGGTFPACHTVPAGQVQSMLKTATGRDYFCWILSASQELVLKEKSLDLLMQRKRKEYLIK